MMFGKKKKYFRKTLAGIQNELDKLGNLLFVIEEKPDLVREVLAKIQGNVDAGNMLYHGRRSQLEAMAHNRKTNFR